MVEKQVNSAQISRHTKGLPPLWVYMASLGFSIAQCIEGTGLSMDQAKGLVGGMTLEQEFALYRNLLRLTKDPMLGLQLGRQYQPQTYGMFGYAMMSARDMKALIDICCEFVALSYSHFRFRPFEQDDLYGVHFEISYPIPEDLIQIFSDRDLEACFTLIGALGADRSFIQEVHLSYTDDANLAAYEKHFSCPVIMGQSSNAVLFTPSALDYALPWADVQAMDICRDACRELLKEINANNTIKSKVVDYFIANPGVFPTIEQMSEEFALPARTLRRKLQQEGTSYQELLKNVRIKLAKQYLKDNLAVERIAELTGYSETSAFSRAFKKWTGVSPQEYRQTKPTSY